MEDEVLLESETDEEIQEESSEDEFETSEQEEGTEEIVESESEENIEFDYERLESAVLQDDFTLDSDLNDLFLTDVLLLFVVFVLVVIFASKEV